MNTFCIMLGIKAKPPVLHNFRRMWKRLSR